MPEQDYRAKLEAYYLIGLKTCKRLGHTIQPKKVAAIAATHKLRDELKKDFGTGKEPAEALYAIRDFLGSIPL